MQGRLGHRPGLDGVRALAVVLVLATQVFGLAGDGGVGVDLFFVLSGFLVTTLLLEERYWTGRISLAGFYARRVRRLLPAFLVMVAVYLAACAALGALGRAGLASDALLGLSPALTYTTNVALAAGSTGLHVEPGLRHLWSLAAQVQLYALWPLLVLAARGRALVGLLLALVLGSAGAVVVLDQTGADAARLAFGPDTRSLPFLVGCGIGMLHASHAWSRAARWLAGLAPLGLLGCGAAVVAFRNAEAPSPARLILVSVAAALLVAGVVRESPLTRVLAYGRYVARISYGLYLWQGPVLALFGVVTAAGAGHGSPVARAAAVIATVVLAVASYELVERRLPSPRRGRDRLSAPAVA